MPVFGDSSAPPLLPAFCGKFLRIGPVGRHSETSSLGRVIHAARSSSPFLLMAPRITFMASGTWHLGLAAYLVRTTGAAKTVVRKHWQTGESKSRIGSLHAPWARQKATSAALSTFGMRLKLTGRAAGRYPLSQGLLRWRIEVCLLDRPIAPRVSFLCCATCMGGFAGMGIALLRISDESVVEPSSSTLPLASSSFHLSLSLMRPLLMCHIALQIASATPFCLLPPSDPPPPPPSPVLKREHLPLGAQPPDQGGQGVLEESRRGYCAPRQ